QGPPHSRMPLAALSRRLSRLGNEETEEARRASRGRAQRFRIESGPTRATVGISADTRAFERSSSRSCETDAASGARRHVTATLEFGLDTFVPVTVDDAGLAIGGDQVIRNTVEEAVLAEAVGIDSFNIGEHYRPEFMDSAGHVILAAIAGRTERIRLGTAVTV